MQLIKQLLRINYIRNHFLRFGWNGLIFYVKQLFISRKKEIKFKHKEYKYPLYLRAESSDIQTFYQVLFNQEYNIKLEFKPNVIIDLGANIGLSSVFFANKFPESKIIALEPEKNNYDMLLKNTKNYQNIVIYHNAIWHKHADLSIKDNNLGEWGYSVMESTHENQDNVKTLTMIDLINIHQITQIDILKIDIEGSEIELFQSNFEQWLPITKVIIIELHDWLRKGCSKQFFSTLVNYDFVLSHKGENIICYLNS
ncbi:MAG: FkbM family methyltransferase [Bacteroidales bacterium]|nr:FkbM family methyltransferase [Bacteroidales bacterium]